jgi:hypothetical protein
MPVSTLVSYQFKEKMKMIRFQTFIYRVGNQRCVAVPRTVALQCGDGRYVPVIAEIGNHRFESTLLPAKGGDFRLVVPVKVFRSMDIDEGASIQVGLLRDPNRQAPELPPDFVPALEGLPSGVQVFQSQSIAMQRQVLRYVDCTKTQATRSKHIEAAIDEIAHKTEEETSVTTASTQPLRNARSSGCGRIIHMMA